MGTRSVVVTAALPRGDGAASQRFRSELSQAAGRPSRSQLTAPGEVTVQPVEHVLHHQRARRDVPAVVSEVALVALPGPQQSEHRQLRGLDRMESVVAAVHHQRRHLHQRREVDGVHLGHPTRRLEPARDEDAHAYAILNRRENRTEGCTPAEAVVRDRLRVEVAARLQVVDGARKVLRPHEHVIAVPARRGRRVDARLVPPRSKVDL